MSIWNDKWIVRVFLIDGSDSGAEYYFLKKEEAEKFRISIVSQKNIEAVYLEENENFEEGDKK
jgi:hypothetical protein